MIFIIGIGTLTFDNVKKQVSDGNIFYKVLSPSLKRLLNKNPSRSYVCGRFLAIKNIIFCFKKEKRYTFKHYLINETTDVCKIMKTKRKERIVLKKIIVLFLTTIYFMGCMSPTYAFKNYPTNGIASYYTKNDKCDPFLHTTTASNELFDENAFTCAMRHREFGHYYKVTNLENNKSVIVKHNDFGPSKKLFEKGRIVDLSRGAFETIADLDKGLIKVKIERIK